jgi:hypothetical protein
MTHGSRKHQVRRQPHLVGYLPLVQERVLRQTRRKPVRVCCRLDPVDSFVGEKDAVVSRVAGVARGVPGRHDLVQHLWGDSDAVVRNQPGLSIRVQRRQPVGIHVGHDDTAIGQPGAGGSRDQAKSRALLGLGQYVSTQSLTTASSSVGVLRGERFVSLDDPRCRNFARRPVNQDVLQSVHLGCGTEVTRMELSFNGTDAVTRCRSEARSSFATSSSRRVDSRDRDSKAAWILLWSFNMTAIAMPALVASRSTIASRRRVLARSISRRFSVRESRSQGISAEPVRAITAPRTTAQPESIPAL